MDTKELVTDKYGRREARVEQNANGFHWALDNWMYTANGDVSLRLKDGKFEVQQDAVARRVGRDAGRRGPHLPQHERVGAARRLRADAVLHPQSEPAAHARQLRGAARSTTTRSTSSGRCGRRPAPTAPISSAFAATTARCNRFTAVCAPLVYRGDRLPAELYGNVFVAEPAANLVSRIILEDDGTTLRARKAYERGEFLASTDERFRPVYLSNAPDGTLYIVDMYRGVIQQRADITEYLRDHIVKPQARTADRARPDLPRRARDDAAGHEAGAVEGAAGAARGDAVASERLVARHGAAAARRARRDGGRPGAGEAGRAARRTGGRGCTRCGRSTASTARAGNRGGQGARGPVARRARLRDPARGAVARRGRNIRFRRRC